MYKRSKKIKLSLNVTGIGLTVVGSVVGSVTLNPTIFAILTGTGVITQGYVTNSNLANKLEHCKFAYTSYDKILIQLRNFIRGMPYDDMIFLSDIKVLDDLY